MGAVDIAQGRAALERWQAARPDDFYEATPNLARARRARLGDDLDALEPRLQTFGRAVARVVDPAVTEVERHRQLPALRPGDSLGHERQEVEFHPAQAVGTRAVWASGIVGAPAFEQAALLYLLAQAGEGGHTCPVVCTAGLVRALRSHGTPELRDRFLPPLLETDSSRSERGAQFLTEVQGGSDVGANETSAVPDGDERDAWRITGEKWFCSVADADQFVVTARAEGAGDGTAGLGCFLVPRLLSDGSPNGFRLRRLKDKLGTRALATGEIEFDGALGYPLGPLDDGFRIAAGAVLNTSRWLNAVGCAGLMRRAYLEASTFARHRIAFGRRIGTFAPVRENLAVMKSEEYAALASTLEVTSLVDRLDRGDADVGDRALHRILVNANKVATSLAATAVVRRGIEVLGGNGTIEDFSPLPRLWRDAIVLESWEGTHDVLCAQVLRDLARQGSLDVICEQLHSRLAALGGDAEPVLRALGALGPRLRSSVEDPRHGALHARRQVLELVRVVQAVCLLEEAAHDRGADDKTSAATFFIRRRLVAGYEPEDDPAYEDLVDRVLAGDTDG